MASAPMSAGTFSQAAAQKQCTEVSRGVPAWPDATTRLTEVTWHGAASPVIGRLGTPVSVPAHCEVQGRMQDRVGIDGQHYAIRFHVRLPVHWNGRFLFEGGGGSNGDLGSAIGMINPGVTSAIERGFAVASQDSGHDNATNSDPEHGGQVAFGFDPEARENYGGRSLEPVAEAAKALIRRFYGRSPHRSYFVGCSKGGQEGMAFAQRYPEEFDGIVAGAPGFSLPRAAIAEALDTQAFASLLAKPEGQRIDASSLPSAFTDEQFAIVRKSILAACDADDGLRDGITASFATCTWKKLLSELQRGCPEQDNAACLSAAQIAALERVLSGPRDGGGRPLYSDWPIDAGVGSAQWRLWKIGALGSSYPGNNVALGASSLAAVFTTPPTAVPQNLQSDFDYVMHFDVDIDGPKIYAVSPVFLRSAWDEIGARSSDLTRFRAHGGKLIVPHGASDPVFSLNDTLAWYGEVDAVNGGSAADFVRVFPVPGMAHCFGGPATDRFDALSALMRWVERGSAPDRILATAGPTTPWPGRTRPLCPYPKIARYTGSGSIEKAANFRCQ